MNPEYLFKILSLENWEKSQSAGKVYLTEHDNDFVHLALEEQLERIIKKYWSHFSEIVILKLDTQRLSGDLVLESNPGGVNKYYHLYRGYIPLEAILNSKIVKFD